MHTATFIKRIPGWRGEARLYRLDPPIVDRDWDDNPSDEYEYVIVSAAVADYSGPETYIFPATEDGEAIDMGELPGSYRGGLSHAEALDNAGYEVA
jgi:hypothetical protein